MKRKFADKNEKNVIGRDIRVVSINNTVEDFNPLVSIVVPAYNAEDTLKNTVEDILSQTFNDFELILVNDGSTDKTEIICREYSDKDNRIVVLSQKNGGLSNARNNGTKIAKGQYITYIDADDRVESYYLEYLIRALKENDVDMVCGRTNRVKEGDSDILKNETYRAEVFNKKEAVCEMLTGKKITVGPCNRLVPRAWYIENPFLEGKKYEDLSNSYKLHLKASSVAFVDANIYHYVMRGGSITGSKIIKSQQCMDYYEAINMCVKGVLKEFPDIIDDVSVLKARDYMSLYLNINRCSEKNEKLRIMESVVLKWIKKYWKYAFKNKKAPINVRLRLLLFRINPLLYRMFYYVGIRIKGKAIA